MKKIALRVLAALLIVFVLIQLWPVDRSNPDVTKPLQAPPDVAAILKRSCYDCHSNETVWPWYAHVAPVSWLVAHDVHEGREHLNFSAWGGLDELARMSKASDMVEQIERGYMPLPIYLRMHGDAVLSPADVGILRKWAESFE